jgi:hypothetical protein
MNTIELSALRRDPARFDPYRKVCRLPKAAREKMAEAVAQALPLRRGWQSMVKAPADVSLELSKSLEPAKARCARSVDLAETFRAAGKLEAGLTKCRDPLIWPSERTRLGDAPRVCSADAPS